MPNTSELSHGLQLWVNLPRSEKMCEPRYQELPASAVPIAKPPGNPNVKVKVIAGESCGVQSTVLTKTPIFYLDVEMSPNSVFKQPIPSGFTAFAYILNGQATFGADDIYREAHYTLVLGHPEAGTADHIELRTGDQPVHCVLIGGQPINVMFS
jgi:redox-sensitive bicupin YhaK (pirin superfamily)